ncbi:hypothetical protein [Methylobacterium sp. WSM2598]|uniref:hypothetical protein n=1 Tax=Methylobacterium sp. WSM2598 TaxID=398261 RepID=UPI000378ABF5|nr:hypothetical protein [Methylobacterium sp. WSM2598]
MPVASRPPRQPPRAAKLPASGPPPSRPPAPTGTSGRASLILESGLTTAEIRRRVRAAALERATFAAVIGLGIATTGFAAYTFVGGPMPVELRPIVPPTAGPMAWKRGITATPPQDLDPLVTGSLPDPRTPTAPGQGGARTEPAGRGYTVRGVQEGVALIEGPSGLRRVEPGTELPGAGRVLSILPSGGGWIVVTSETIIPPGGSVARR